MKKVFLFLMLIAFAVFNQSCGDSDNSPKNPNEDISINPPEWIQGTWGTPANEFSEAVPTFRFTKDDVITIAGMQELSNKENIKSGKGVYDKIKVEETITDSAYYLKITFGANSIIYKFKKVTENKIKWIQQNGIPSPYLSRL